VHTVLTENLRLGVLGTPFIPATSRTGCWSFRWGQPISEVKTSSAAFAKAEPRTVGSPRDARKGKKSGDGTDEIEEEYEKKKRGSLNT